MPVSPPSRCDIDCATCRLGSRTIYSPIYKQNPQTVHSARKGIVTLRANQTILRAGETSNFVYTLYSGWAFCGVTLSDGRRQIMAFLLPGDTVCFASLFKRPSVTTTKALTDITLCMFDTDDMSARLFGPGGQREAFDTLIANRIIELTNRLTDIGRRRASGRLAQFLLNIEARLRANDLSGNGAFDFPPRQEHIADALGLTPVHVNRTLVQLRRMGVIDFSKGKMRLVNLDKLRQIAEED